MDHLPKFFRKTSNISKLIELEVPHLMQGRLLGLLKTLKKSSHPLAKHPQLSLRQEENNKSIDL